jgi:hypothetical protein
VPQSILLRFNTTGQSPFAEIVLSATGNPWEYAGDIPAMPGGTVVYYFIAAADDKGRTGYAPRAALAGDLFSFYIAPPTAVHEPAALPEHFALRAFPNPFHGRIALQYDLPANIPAAITLEIVNILGQRVRLLAQGETQPGRYQTTWTGVDEHDRPAPAGVYFYRLRSSEVTHVRKILLVR